MISIGYQRLSSPIIYFSTLDKKKARRFTDEFITVSGITLKIAIIRKRHEQENDQNYPYDSKTGRRCAVHKDTFNTQIGLIALTNERRNQK
jgi:hypothetical protein